MARLNNILNRFDRWMAAVTFAEAGEPNTALSFLNQKPRKRNMKRKKSDVRTEERTRPVLRV
jgi:hypothetical protein